MIVSRTNNDVHNMIRSIYPDGRFNELTYNKEKDWVTSFKEFSGCVESYTYEMAEVDSKTHFWSTMEKRCGDEIANKARYEFFHVPSKFGVRLQRVIATRNDVRDMIDYHEEGRIIRINRDGLNNEYRYDPLGRLVMKQNGIKIEHREYESTCDVPTSLRQGTVDAVSGRQAYARWTFVRYYAVSCLPLLAYRSDGKLLKFSYDGPLGHVKIVNEQKSVIHLEYESDLRAPVLISLEGLGEGSVLYDGDEPKTVNEKRGGASSELLEILKIIREMLPDRGPFR